MRLLYVAQLRTDKRQLQHSSRNTSGMKMFLLSRCRQYASRYATGKAGIVAVTGQMTAY